MVNAAKMSLSPLLAGEHGKSTKKSTRRHHQANKGKSGLEGDRVRALGGLRSVRYKKKLSVEKRRARNFLGNQEKEKWIEDYVDGETAVVREQVQDAETAIMQEQENMRNVEKARLTTTNRETTFEEMLNANGDSVRDPASSEDEDDGDDEDDDEEDTVLGKLSEDDEPGWVMGTISKTVQHSMESILQKQMRLDELTQPGQGDAADHFCE